LLFAIFPLLPHGDLIGFFFFPGTSPAARSLSPRPPLVMGAIPYARLRDLLSRSSGKAAPPPPFPLPAVFPEPDFHRTSQRNLVDVHPFFFVPRQEGQRFQFSFPLFFFSSLLLLVVPSKRSHFSWTSFFLPFFFGTVWHRLRTSTL